MVAFQKQGMKVYQTPLQMGFAHFTCTPRFCGSSKMENDQCVTGHSITGPRLTLSYASIRFRNSVIEP